MSSTTDQVLAERHPATWNLDVQSRTWYGVRLTRDVPGAQVSVGPFVVVYGPLFYRTSAVISTPQPPLMPFWSYDNGDVRIMVAAERPQ